MNGLSARTWENQTIFRRIVRFKAKSAHVVVVAHLHSCFLRWFFKVCLRVFLLSKELRQKEHQKKVKKKILPRPFIPPSVFSVFFLFLLFFFSSATESLHSKIHVRDTIMLIIILTFVIAYPPVFKCIISVTTIRYFICQHLAGLWSGHTIPRKRGGRLL